MEELPGPCGIDQVLVHVCAVDIRPWGVMVWEAEDEWGHLFETLSWPCWTMQCQRVEPRPHQGQYDPAPLTPRADTQLHIHTQNQSESLYHIYIAETSFLFLFFFSEFFSFFVHNIYCTQYINIFIDWFYSCFYFSFFSTSSWSYINILNYLFLIFILTFFEILFNFSSSFFFFF